MAATTGDEVAYEAGVVTEEGAVVVDAYATAEGEAASGQTILASEEEAAE